VASKSSNSGAVVLVILALIGIGLAADDDGGTDAAVDQEVDVGTGDDGDSDDFDFGDTDGDTCDGVVIVQSASGTAEVPGGVTRTESSSECSIDEGGGDEDAVRALQDALVRCNGQDIEVDGEFGQQTSEAVARVEEQNGLEIDGTYDAATRDAMSWPATSPSGTEICVTDVSSSSADDSS
jgi:Putative peptidoglycan binding domain